MSRTDKDKPWWVQAAQAPVGDQIVKHDWNCETISATNAYQVRRRAHLGVVPCTLTEYRNDGGCHVTLALFEQYTYWAHVLSSTRASEHVYFTRPERSRVRDELRAAAREFNLTGETDVDIAPIGTPRGPGGCHCC